MFVPTFYKEIFILTQQRRRFKKIISNKLCDKEILRNVRRIQMEKI